MDRNRLDVAAHAASPLVAPRCRVPPGSLPTNKYAQVTRLIPSGSPDGIPADEIAHGIRVNCVSPGTVASPWVERTVAALYDPEAGFEALRRRQPLGRMVTCAEVAAAVAYLADDTTFTTGADFLLDGGITGVRIVE